MILLGSKKAICKPSQEAHFSGFIKSRDIKISFQKKVLHLEKGGRSLELKLIH